MPALAYAKLPQVIATAMKNWQLGFGVMPLTYIEWHEQLARKRLEQLVGENGFRKIEVVLKDDGWMDGMKVLTVIIETLSGKVIKARWVDDNQDFMIDTGHGCRTQYPEDWR